MEVDLQAFLWSGWSKISLVFLPPIGTFSSHRAPCSWHRRRWMTMATMSVQPATPQGPHLATTPSRFKVGPPGGCLSVHPSSPCLAFPSAFSIVPGQPSLFLALGQGRLLRPTTNSTQWGPRVGIYWKQWFQGALCSAGVTQLGSPALALQRLMGLKSLPARRTFLPNHSASARCLCPHNRPADVCGAPVTQHPGSLEPFLKSHPMSVTSQSPGETLKQDQAWPSSPAALVGPTREGWIDNGCSTLLLVT